MASLNSYSNGSGPPMTAATKLRGFLANSNKILLCPGVYDGFSTRIALSVGFDALYMVIKILSKILINC